MEREISVFLSFSVGAYSSPFPMPGLLPGSLDNIMIELSKTTNLKIELALGQEQYDNRGSSQWCAELHDLSSLVAVVDAKSCRKFL